MAKRFVTTAETKAWGEEWEKSAALREEFSSEAQYVGFKRAEAEGRVSTHRGNLIKGEKPAA